MSIKARFQNGIARRREENEVSQSDHVVFELDVLGSVRMVYDSSSMRKLFQLFHFAFQNSARTVLR